jgi:hypothetical protein
MRRLSFRDRGEMSIRSRVLATAAALGCLAAAACSSDAGSEGDDTTAPTVTETVTTSAPPTGSSSSASSTPPAAAGCPAGGTGMPAGSVSRTVIDVDGDGRPDTAWFAAGGGSFGITTASGGSYSIPVTFAGGAQPSALVADVTGDGEIVAFVTNGRAVDLLRFQDCALAEARNPQGQPYTFDLGFTGFGTGVGCVDATGDGVRDLVGLNIERDGSGQAARITRTVVELTGLQASNGPTSEVPVTPEAVTSAQAVTCGDLTLEVDGLTA